jgi:threonine/homoserine/homoserine lactone efflux protein
VTLAAFLAFAGLTLLGAISPGPAVLMSARTGLTEGFRTGAFLAMGIGAGAVFWAISAMFGLNILFAFAPGLLTAFKIAGGGYLLWMGWKLWQQAPEPLDTANTRPVPRTARSALWLGLATQLANPKPAILLGAIFLGTIPPGTPVWVYLAILTVLFLNETIWNMIVARIFSLNRTRTIYLSLKTTIDRLFGGLLALIGLKIAAT